MFLRTQRLFLRPAWLEDASELTFALAHEPVVRMLARVPWPCSEDNTREFIAKQRDPRWPSLLVTRPDAGGRIIGACGIHRDDKGLTEAGYWIEPGHWGQGFATEALLGLLSLARLIGHQRIVARHAADNPASGRVLYKAGFRPTGRARVFHSLGRGADVDAPEYVLDLGEVSDPQDVRMPQAA